MKKKLIAALVIAMTMGIFAGCGGEEDPASPVATLNPSPVIIDEPASSEESAEESAEERICIAVSLRMNG